MKSEDFERAKQIEKEALEARRALESMERLNLSNGWGLRDNYDTIRLSSVVDPAIGETVKALITSHLAAKLDKLDAEFEKLGGAV